MKFLSRAISGLFLLLVCFSFISIGAWRFFEASGSVSERPRPPARENAHPVKTARFETSSFAPSIEVYGEIRVWRSLAIRAPASGEITYLFENFKEGASVEAGELLAEVDPVDAESRLAQAQLTLSQSRLDAKESRATITLIEEDIRASEDQFELKKQELERVSALVDKKLAANAELEAQQIAVLTSRQALLAKRQQRLTQTIKADNADLAIERALLNIKDAETALSKTRIVAPFSGKLSEVEVALGSRVTQSERLGELLDLSSLEVQFTVAEDVFGRLIDNIGNLRTLPVVASLMLGDQAVSLKGHLDRDAAMVDSAQGGRVIYARLVADEQSLIRPGDFVVVTIEEDLVSNQIVVPLTALDNAGNMMVVSRENRLEEVNVKVERRLIDRAIVTNVPMNMPYVVNHSPQLTPGLLVKPTGPKPEQNNENDKTGPDENGLIALSPQRRSDLVAFVEGNNRMPEDVKKRLLENLKKDRVKAKMVERIESRMAQ